MPASATADGCRHTGFPRKANMRPSLGKAATRFFAGWCYALQLIN